MKTHGRLFASVLVLASLVGCASGPKFNTVEANLGKVPDDKARIYFYRSSAVGAAIQPEVRLNGTVVGKAEPHGVFFVDQAPGNMEVSTSTEVEKKLSFTAAAKETRFVKLSVALGLMVGRIVPDLVDEAEARKEIAELSYTGAQPKK